MQKIKPNPNSSKVLFFNRPHRFWNAEALLCGMYVVVMRKCWSQWESAFRPASHIGP
jgi:hypothetical protein